MTRQWIREVSLVIGNGSEAVNVSGLRIRFTVNVADRQAPGRADIFVNNLSKATANRIEKEYDRCVLQVGWRGGGLDTIFDGEIVQKRKGRESPTDTYLSILAKDGQKAYSFAVVNKTLAAGHTMRDQVDACLEVMKPLGVVAGYITDLGTATFPRGRALLGMARDHLRDICRSAGASWSIQQGKLQIVKNNEVLPGEAVVLNSRTGMIGMPVQTLNGIEVRCLLNPKIRVGSIVQIDQASIQRQSFTLDYAAQAQNSLIPEVADDGYYKVLDITHTGDTRNDPWYSDLICLSMSGKIIPSSLATRLLNVKP